MKFAVKVFLVTVVVVAICFAIGGYILISSVFDTALDAAVDAALETNRMLCFGFTTAVANIPVSYEVLPDEVLRGIVNALEAGALTETLYFSLRDMADGGVIYSRGPNLFSDYPQLAAPDLTERLYRLGSVEDSYYIQTISLFEVPGRTLILETHGDVTGVFAQREETFSTYRKAVAAAIVLTAVFMLFISYYLTRPIRELMKTSHRIESGDLEARANIHSGDEMEKLSSSFNAMAESLEGKIHQLEDEGRSREEFIASFAHELKTPLTAIIGYSDMLRSREMNPKDRFTAANYIFSEGRRLESLSLKLMDIIVLRRYEPELRLINGRVFLSEIAGIVQPMFRQSGIKLKVRSEPEAVWLEPDLMKTLVMNLLDNARKATEEGGRVELYGQQEGGRYAIIVRDFGRGIPQKELAKITEAFYMVDKSRSRARGGAGLGLAICAEIAELHGTSLEFKSYEGHGTAVRVLLKGGNAL